MLRDLEENEDGEENEENEDDEPDEELKEILEPKATEPATTEVKKEEVDAAKKKVKL
ncbi:MAG TPA: hypothetical protein VIX38_04875 [Nitrososphaeraceae archaeon]